MRLFSIGFSFGIISLILLPAIPSHYWINVGLFVAAIFLLTINEYIKNFVPRLRLLRLLFAFLIGLTWAMLFASWQLINSLPKNIENQNVIVRGTIISIPEQEQLGKRFIFAIQQLQQNQTIYPSPGKVRLTWEGQQIPILRVGDRWQFAVRLKRPHGTFDPGSFDEEGWLFSQQLRATGYVRNDPANLLLSSKWYQSPLGRLRQFIAGKISQQLAYNPMLGFITALSVGVRNAITPAQWQVLRNTGTNHLMAIAGLHIGFFAGAIFFISNFLWRRFSKLTLRFPAQQAAACAALLAAVFYAALAGFSLPTQRAIIMLAVFLLAILCQRHLPPWQALLLALMIILFLDPLATLSSSFWLSFAAVGFIIYGMSGRLNSSNKLHHWLKIQWILAVGLIPVTLYFFQQVSLAGLFANIIAIPVIGFLVLPLTVLGCLLQFLPLCAGIILKLAALILSWVWILLERISVITWLQWHAAIENYQILIVTIIAAILLLAPAGLKIRRLSIFGLLPLLFWRPALPAKGEIYFTLLDVGQGLSAVVQTSRHLLVYDTGAKYGDSFDMGDAVVVPYVRTLGIGKIDALVISHGDNDHIGGAASVLRELAVTKIFSSVPEKFPPQVSQACIANQHWQWDGVDFTFLYPYAGKAYDDNNSSCVLRVSNGYKTILLTGDIQREGEKYLLQSVSQFLPATILVAPHHGSSTSSSSPFIAAVKPQYVLFPVGYLNRYHFPNAKVIARYQQAGTMCYNSVSSGAIMFDVKNNDMPQAIPAQYRHDHGHFWNFK